MSTQSPNDPQRVTQRPNDVPIALVAVVDHLAFLLGVLTVAMVRFAVSPPERPITAYLGDVPLLSLFLAVLLFAFDLYRSPKMPFRVAMSSLARPLVLTALAGTLAASLAPGIAFPRDVIAIGIPVGCLLILAWRVLLHRLDNGSGRRQQVALVVDRESRTPGNQASALKKLRASHDDVDVALIVDYRERAALAEALGKIDIVVIAAAVPAEPRSRMAVDLLQENIRVLVMPAPFDVVLASSRSTHYHGIDGIELAPNLERPFSALVKRLVDLTASLCGLIILAPVAVLVAAVVRLDSPGAVIFTQTRVGQHGREFSIRKFRTMRPDAEAETGPVFAAAADTRITRVGHLLRRSRLDEIPQLWNVLVGDMSLVGPRPERPEFVDGFAREVPAYNRRHQVKPGITGLAQVRAGYSATVEEKLRFDLLYINRVNLLLDLRLLVQTVATVIDFSAAEGVTADDAALLSAVSDRRSERREVGRVNDADSASPQVPPAVDVTREL